jgi:hypothetical protein
MLDCIPSISDSPVPETSDNVSKEGLNTEQHETTGLDTLEQENGMILFMAHSLTTTM